MLVKHNTLQDHVAASHTVVTDWDVSCAFLLIHFCSALYLCLCIIQLKLSNKRPTSDNCLCLGRAVLKYAQRKMHIRRGSQKRVRLEQGPAA